MFLKESLQKHTFHCDIKRIAFLFLFLLLAHTPQSDIPLYRTFHFLYLNYLEIYHYKSTHLGLGINAVLSLLDTFAQEGGSAFSVMSAAVSASNPVEAVAKRFAMVSKKQKVVRVHFVFRFFVCLLCIHGNIYRHNCISVHYRYSSYYLNFIYFHIILITNVPIFFYEIFAVFPL